jgi:pyrimidine and pyridine-specific 5'-nucleotidase
MAVIRGDGKGSFDETKIRVAIRSLSLPDRMRLLHIILDSCLPGDIPNMIAQLQKYARSVFDILSHLPQNLAARVLTFLPIPDLLSSSLTSKAWNALVHDPSIWRYHCLILTRTDPTPLRSPADPTGWENLYKSLYHREQNWKLGLCQNIRFFKGHTGFVTTLLLKGKRLISGSYDETIRVWDIGELSM